MSPHLVDNHSTAWRPQVLASNLRIDLVCVSNSATNSHDTINDNHYQSATGDTVQLEMKCRQFLQRRWFCGSPPPNSDINQGCNLPDLYCTTCQAESHAFVMCPTRQQTVTTQSTTTTINQQRVIHTVQLEMKCMQKGAPLGRSGTLHWSTSQQKSKDEN